MRILQPIMELERFYNLHVSFSRGRYVGSRLIRLGMRRLGLKAPIMRGPQGLLLEYSPDFSTDTVVRDVFLGGSFEAEETSILERLTPPGGVFVDVGANLGYFVLLASRWVGSAGRIFAFEPVPNTAAQLRRNIDLNGCNNVIVIENACGSEPGETRMCVSMDSGKAYLGSDGLGDLTVGVITLDDFVAGRGLDRLDLLKIDVEGADFEVVKGAQETIRRFRPAIWLETMWLHRFGSTVGDVCRYLKASGYECTEKQGERSTDLLCIPRS